LQPALERADSCSRQKSLKKVVYSNKMVTETDKKTQKTTTEAPAAPVATTPAPARTEAPRGARGGDAGGDRVFRKNPRRRTSRRPQRERSEFDQKIVSIRRVTRVMAGGRRFSFSVALVAGNRKGKVGVGTGKAGDTSLAIEKAFRAAKKGAVQLVLTKDMSVPHEVEAKYASSVVQIRPAKGRGLVAGSSVRDVLELAGVKDVSAKVLTRSKNKLNNARVAIKALTSLKGKAQVVKK